MCKKMIYLISFVLVSGLVSNTSAGLVGYWKLDEGSGTIAYDSSRNENHGTLNGPIWRLSDGQIGGALEFDGIDDYVEVPDDISFDITNEITVTAWIKPVDVADWRTIVSKYAHTPDWRKDLYWFLNSGNIGISLAGPSGIGGDDWIPDVPIESGTWTHVALSYDGNFMRMYKNGINVATNSISGDLLLGDSTSNESFYIGQNTEWGEYFDGLIDDVQVYNRTLTPDQVQDLFNGIPPTFPKAFSPNPPDDALYPDTWVTLGWNAGDFAVSHDVYMGDNFNDVNDATHESETFRGNQSLDLNYIVAGFVGFPFPDGLVPGTTYYWRIDEVNDANPNSPWKGDIWSFLIPPKTAYYPVPADSAKFIDPQAVSIKWTAGFGAKLHTVYFGDDYETVANATGGTTQGIITYNPGSLETDKTYYWRVDEFDGVATYIGEVWSFSTAKKGGGIRGDYYNGTNFETFALTRTDEQVNFSWGSGEPDPVVGSDNFSVRWTGEVEAAFTETYTFYATADDGVRLWVDGVQLVNEWVDQSATEYRGTIDLVTGNTYSVVMEMYENGGDAVAQLRWSSPSTPKQLIPQSALAPPVKASSPSPNNGATGTKLTPILRWNVGDYASSHEVYFGTNADVIANADKSSPEYKGIKALGDESYDPGKLAWFTTYYWRIDEVNNTNPDSPWVGNLWSFTTGDFIVVDDFEDYNADKNQIWYAWKDGLGYGAPGSDPYYPGNGTGAAVGDETTASYTEETIIHSGNQSMPLTYNNNKQGYSKYSEVELTLTSPRDWTEESVVELSIWFRGYPASTGSFIEGPAGIYTMTASGADIWAVNGVEADEFHFAYKTLSGAGSIIARVDSLQNTNAWAKAGVMIRESLDPDSAHAFACVTPANGVASQYRPSTDGTSVDYNQTGVAAPHWVKLERGISGNFTVSHSANGTSWQPVTGAVAQNIPMGSNVYIGLALTSHDTAQTCQAVFSNVTTTGNVTGQWAHQDIGILSNDAEPLYVAVSNATGSPAVVVHDDPAAAQINTWTEWVIPLSVFTDQSIDLTNVDRIALGLGTRGNTTIPGGSGKMYFDDIRLFRSRDADE
jgi:hypothetical protein